MMDPGSKIQDFKHELDLEKEFKLCKMKLEDKWNALMTEGQI